MVSSSTGELSSTLKSISNTNLRSNKTYSLNNQNILINYQQHGNKLVQLKNVILKETKEVKFDNAMFNSKKDVYEPYSTFKFLEYVDARRLPINVFMYQQGVYDVVTTSKVTSHFFLEKLIKQQRHMLVYSKACGKYLILYYTLPHPLRSGSDETIKFIDIVDKIQMKALDISLPKMLVEIYKNTDRNIDQDFLNDRVGEENPEDFGDPISYEYNSENIQYNSSLNAKIFSLNQKIDRLQNDNDELKKQNEEIKKQNELIIQLLIGTFDS
ncbi:hypothetical protein ACO0R3_003201 [Hanseniaspora guilliermondii]